MLISRRNPAGIAAMSFVATLIRSGCFAVCLAAAVDVLPAVALECASEPVSARGLGFTPSPERSAEAAKEEWLKKAQTVYGDAKWETAKDPDMFCAMQGLYSNCKVTAKPCGTVPATPKPQ
jgi:hypothetical protein